MGQSKSKILSDKSVVGEASKVTCEVNNNTRQRLPQGREKDIEDAKRGFLGTLQEGTICDQKGNVIWDLDQYDFLEKTSVAPVTANPALWSQAQLQAIHGLFKVADGVFQVRGFDAANISFICGNSGVIIVDPLAASETAKAAYDLFKSHFPNKSSVVAVIFSHSHVDHYGGVFGVTSKEDIDSGRVQVIAPDGFYDEAISESVFGGNAKRRRGIYQHGALLPKNVTGNLAWTVASGQYSLIKPTQAITQSPQELEIDGRVFTFQLVPETEAPAELNFFLADSRALYMAETAINSMHNLLTPRGESVRDAKAWSQYLDEAIRWFCDKAEALFHGHTWPRWNNEEIREYLEKQRDLYAYIHDQSLGMINQGYAPWELANEIRLPKSLKNDWLAKEFYGTLTHNAMAIYQKYIGFYDGNPAHLNVLSEVEAAKKYVEYMGGAVTLLKKAHQSFENGEYRWVAQVLNHLIFAEPHNYACRQLQAATFEQLGYQAESAAWRNIYLTGAAELRGLLPKQNIKPEQSAKQLSRLPIHFIFDQLATRLNGHKADGKQYSFMFKFNNEKDYTAYIKNAVLHHGDVSQLKQPVDATIAIAITDFAKLVNSAMELDEATKVKAIEIEGSKEKFVEFLKLFDSFDTSFNLSLPRLT